MRNLAQPASEPPRTSAAATPSKLSATSAVRRAFSLLPALARATSEDHGNQAQQGHSNPNLARRDCKTNALPLCTKGLHNQTLLISLPSPGGAGACPDHRYEGYLAHPPDRGDLGPGIYLH